MYTLKFGTEDVDKRRFEYIYDGFIIGGSLPVNSSKNIQILRRELRLLTKLESISEEYPCGKKVYQDEPKRKTIGGEISLPDDEFDLLVNYIAAVPWNSGNPARWALEAIDWMKQ